MKIKRTATLLMAAMLCIVMVGCSAKTTATEGSSSAQQAASAAPSSTPVPKEGLEVVFDKAEIYLAVISNGDDAASSLFFEAAKREAESMGLTVTTDAAGSGFDAAVAKAAETADALVAFMPEGGSSSALSGLSIPAAVFTVNGSDMPQEISHLSYDPAKELDTAFNAALVYPPHDTPVRLILMFESADSEAHTAYKTLYDKGMIFPKETYTASDSDKKAGEWLTSKMDNYVEGMLDAVFAEDAALAVSAFDSLEALNRTDMEVFCPGITPDVISRMQKNPEVFAQGIGRNDALAGMLCVRAALGKLKGGEAVSQASEPVIINATDIGDDAVASLEGLDAEKAALYNESWMDELRTYYGANENSAK